MHRPFFAFLVATAWLNGQAQSSLPPCPEDASVTWTNCLGTYRAPSGHQYAGSFKNDERHGQGALISRQGYTLVEGVWRDDLTVDTTGGRWRVIGYTDGGVYFVLTNSIRQEGVFRRAWTMMAYEEPHPKYRWLSGRELSKFDCANERYQMLQATLYAGSWGSGEILDSFDEGEWKYLAPGTAFERVAKYICNHDFTDKK
jgi:hypothetical protein